MPEKTNQKSRVLIVSNRLPVTAEVQGNELKFKSSAGGLATAVGSIYKDYSALWAGWPGIVPLELEPTATGVLGSEHNCFPVFLGKDLVNLYYDGFANDTVWPILHSFPTYAKYSAEGWNAYVEVNKIFCNRLCEIIRPGDSVWIHDYHLMLLPGMLRGKLPDASIGFFLHIPFPHFEILRLLPWHGQIVDSLLSADLVGFHTYDYAQNFLGTVRRLRGFDNNVGNIIAGDRVVRVDVFPIGIDFERFSGAAETAETRSEMQRLARISGTNKLVFTVTRLDYTKGIPQTVDAIHRFFERHPEWKEKVVFVLAVVPSRENVPEYAALKKKIDEAIGRVNGKFGTLAWSPITYFYRSLTFAELTALYATADAAMIIPLRDGMNLIAKEYVASKNDGKGVLVLGDLAGASKELLEAVIVNPNSPEDVADSLNTALKMPEQERVQRSGLLRRRLQSNDIRHWAAKFLDALAKTKSLSIELSVRMLSEQILSDISNAYNKAGTRLIMLDYDGTLVGFSDEPENAVPKPEVLELLSRLASSDRNDVVLLSGRMKNILEAWFAKLNITIVGEHGVWCREKNQKKWKTTVNVPTEWKSQIRPILELFVDRIPASFIEEKDFSLTWHYRKSEIETASDAAKDLVDTITNLTANHEIHVLLGSKVVEVKSTRVSKGNYYLSNLSRGRHDFMLAVGDDWTDETLFAVLPHHAHSIRVGKLPSRARFNVESPEKVISLLRRLAAEDDSRTV